MRTVFALATVVALSGLRQIVAKRGDRGLGRRGESRVGE